MCAAKKGQEASKLTEEAYLKEAGFVEGVATFNPKDSTMLMQINKAHMPGLRSGSLIYMAFNYNTNTEETKAFIAVLITAVKSNADNVLCAGRSYWFGLRPHSSMVMVDSVWAHIKEWEPETFKQKRVMLKWMRGESREAFIHALKEHQRPDRTLVEPLKIIKVDGISISYGDTTRSGWMFGNMTLGTDFIGFQIKLSNNKKIQETRGVNGGRIVELEAAIYESDELNAASKGSILMYDRDWRVMDRKLAPLANIVRKVIVKAFN
jgi:hypothetical protein